jgi:hypothetical protein
MPQTFWDDIQKNSLEFFKNPSKYRKKIEDEELIEDEPVFSIDDILNKINENGIESLTVEEKEFLDNNKKDR